MDRLTPDEFEQFWNLRNDYATIFGNRTERGDGKGGAFVEKTCVGFLNIISK